MDSHTAVTTGSHTEATMVDDTPMDRDEATMTGTTPVITTGILRRSADTVTISTLHRATMIFTAKAITIIIVAATGLEAMDAGCITESRFASQLAEDGAASADS